MERLKISHHNYDPWACRKEFMLKIPIKNKLILDIGTGRGISAIQIAKKSHLKVVSIDTNNKKLENAAKLSKKHNCEKNIEFKLHDITQKTEFENKSFDISIMFNTLHHINENLREKTIAEIARITKEKIIIGELNPNGIYLFDEIVHPEENHKAIQVKRSWILDVFKEYGSITILYGDIIDIYLCNLFL
jgi:ubiquinone/menaquinone biosynthesis C-methylase UbiE